MTPKDNITPPKLAQRFLRWFCDPFLLEDVEGDLNELFHTHAAADLKAAKWQYTKDVIFLFRPGIIKSFQFQFNQHLMYKNYLITAWRSAKKYKGHTLLNLLSLIVGVASCILILLWIQDERSIDKFHDNDDRLYRVWRNMHQSSGEIITTGGIPQPLAVTLKNDYPEVDEVGVIGWDVDLLFRKGEMTAYETGKYASPEFFTMFTFPFMKGDPATALDDITSIVISENVADKYFGNEWRNSGSIINETLTVGSDRREVKVTGVFEDPGPKSSFAFDWILPAEEYIARNDWVNSWFNGGFSICFTLRENADLASLQSRILQEINENTDYDADERVVVHKFSDNYLYGTFENGIPVTGRIQYVRILFIVAIFILLIACINFMNLATARSSRRSKEVGVRKVLGAQRGALRHQFFVESFLLSLVAVLLSVTVVYLVLPYFNQLTQKSLILDLTNWRIWAGLGFLTLITGLISGIYPALLLPTFKITSSLKGIAKLPGRGVRLREGLVVFQFALSIILIIGTLIVSQQMDYILNKNLGLDKENMIFVQMPRSFLSQRDVFKTELEKIPEVAGVTITSGNPIDYGRSSGSADWEGKDPNEEVEINVLSVDADFVSTMGAQIIKGRDFSEDFSTDTANYLINEVSANIMGFDDPINKDLSIWGLSGKIIGVVKNFHMSSMYDPIAPLIIRYDPSSTFVSFIRTQGDVQRALLAIEQVSEKLNPGYPFVYEFMDRDYAASYRSEMTLSTIIKFFALISIFIACLGLFGLSSFSAEQRSREIGIRKVYGASVTSIVSMLSWGYTKLVLIAFVIASPIAYYFMNDWLNNFVFRTDLNLFLFLVAGLVTLLIGGFTVGIKSWQAALANPINTLKDE